MRAAPDTATLRPPPLSFETIENAEALPPQIGVTAPRSVPDALYARLFGQPAPAADDLTHPAGTRVPLPLMQTYALLDAAKVANLAEMIACSGLEHRCLFTGATAGELSDVAPWLVRLEAESRFTRRLFTAGRMPGALWDKRPGVFLRSRAGFQPLWAYLRKFTRVRDETGKWFYFRFWEPAFAAVAQEIISQAGAGPARDAGYPVTVIALQPKGI
ncbi:MAG: DUF4123 domain-containing protein [Paracoccus sp. (in: a-proteobacteria)]|nr:DUF4123 domain-containing protein [Paracoccus sp. (in: a-proteobacteria)]